jgi:hypothetical protein
MGEIAMNTKMMVHRLRRSRLARLGMTGGVALLVGATGLFVAVAAAGQFGGARRSEVAVQSLEPGSEKRQILQKEAQTAERLQGMSPPPIQGRPVAQGTFSGVVAHIEESTESAFPQRRSLHVSNFWSSDLNADHQITVVTAAEEFGRGLIIVSTLDLDTGIEQIQREIPLPVDSGTPRIVGFSGGILDIDSSSGSAFTFDVETMQLTPGSVP